MRLLAIDPGPVESAYVLYDTTRRTPITFAKGSNYNMREVLLSRHLAEDLVVIEMIASYGMAVGAEVFETCVWIGRFIEATDSPRRRIFRRDVKLHLCGSARAKDSNIRQALIDRYGPGKDAAIGRKASPGVLYGIKADVWAALAVAVTAADTLLSVPDQTDAEVPA